MLFMSELEDYDQILFQGRGGCLDAMITFLTWGNFGLETKVTQTTLKPFPESPGDGKSVTQLVIEERRTISLSGSFFGPRTERKIIRTPKVKK